MSRIRANTIVNGAGTGAPNFPRGAIISGISTINAEISVGTGTSISSPATNTLALGTNDVERLRITSDGSVGIGTNVPTRSLTVSDGTNPVIAVQNAGQSTEGVFNAPSDGTINLGTTSTESLTLSTNSTERLRVTSGGEVQIANGNLKFSTSGTGIDFSATSDGSGTATSELLDDYEEGTWTPSVAFGATLASQTNQGKYTRIGNTVFISYQLNITGLSGGTGNISVSGLPYACSQVPTYSHGNCQGNASMSLPSGAGSIMPYIENGSNSMRLLYMTNTGHADVTNTVYSTGLAFYGNGIYYTS